MNMSKSCALTPQSMMASQTAVGQSITQSAGSYIAMQDQYITPPIFNYPYNQEETARRKHLESMEAERIFKRNMEVSGSEEVRKITSSIEANNTEILKLQTLNKVLTESRSSYIKELEGEFDKKEPKSEELEKMNADMYTFKLPETPGWTTAGTYIGSTSSGIDPYALSQKTSVPVYQSTTGEYFTRDGQPYPPNI